MNGVRCMTASLLWLLLGSWPAQADSRTEEVLRAYVEVWNTGDLDRLDTLVTEDFQRHGGFASADSREKLRSIIQSSRRFYSGLHIEVFDVVANPEKGAMRWRFSGSWGKTRFQHNSLNFAMYHFTDGKISEEWVLGNNMDLFRTFGFSLTPPQYEIVPPPVEEPPGPTLAQRMEPLAGELESFAAQTREAPPKRAGELRITTEVACRLVLDGSSIGWLAPHGSVALQLDRGEHRIGAVSPGGSTFFETSVAVRKGKMVDVEVEAPGRVIVHPRRRTTEDLMTGLMWQMTDNGENVTKAAAEAYCRDLDQGGHTDWRTPSIHELTSLHAPAATAKRYHTIDGIRLSDCCPWSSTPHADFFWTYAFSMDTRYLQHESLGFHMRVICVRDTVTASNAGHQSQTFQP